MASAVPMIQKTSTGAYKPKLVRVVADIYLPCMKRGTLPDKVHVCFQKKGMMMKETLILN